MFNYYIIYTAKDDIFCCIEENPEGLKEKGWRICEGKRMGHRYPSDVQFHMGRSYPGIVVPDLIRNLCGYCLVSSKLKEIIESEVEAEIEFLPFALYNHKGRIAGQDCYIANVLDTIDCVDLSRSQGSEFKIVPGTFRQIRKLYLNYDRIPVNAKLFRVPQMMRVLIIRDDLKAVLEQSNITGAQYIGMGEDCRVS